MYSRQFLLLLSNEKALEAGERSSCYFDLVGLFFVFKSKTVGGVPLRYSHGELPYGIWKGKENNELEIFMLPRTFRSFISWDHFPGRAPAELIRR